MQTLTTLFQTCADTTASCRPYRSLLYPHVRIGTVCVHSTTLTASVLSISTCLVSHSPNHGQRSVGALQAYKSTIIVARQRCHLACVNQAKEIDHAWLHAGMVQRRNLTDLVGQGCMIMQQHTSQVCSKASCALSTHRPLSGHPHS